jgi:hypothetical protein
MKTLSILIIMAASLASACTSSTAQRKDPTPTPERSNSNVVKTNTPPTPNNGVSPSSGNTSSGRPVRNVRGRERIDINPSATPLPLSFEKAGENSQFALSMDNTGAVIETRLFEKHPQLKKAELRTSDAKTRVLKLYLTNGKTTEGRTEKLKSIKTASATELLAVAGIKAPGQTPKPGTAMPKR